MRSLDFRGDAISVASSAGLAAIGFPVRRLVRTQIGPIKLGDLKSGSYRVLSQTEVRSLSKAVGL